MSIRFHQDRTSVEFNPENGPIHLEGEQYLRMKKARGWVIRALNGRVWITQDWDLRDIVLEAGQSFTLDRDSDALIWPLDKGEVRLERESGRALQRRVTVATAAIPALSPARALLA